MGLLHTRMPRRAVRAGSRCYVRSSIGEPHMRTPVRIRRRRHGRTLAAMAALGMLMLGPPAQAQTPPAGASANASVPRPPANKAAKRRAEPQKPADVISALCNLAKAAPAAIMRFLGG
jgi:hypothetical protein